MSYFLSKSICGVTFPFSSLFSKISQIMKQLVAHNTAKRSKLEEIYHIADSDTLRKLLLYNTQFAIFYSHKLFLFKKVFKAQDTLNV